MMTTEATPEALGSNDQLGPAAWAVMAYGRVQKLVVRADVADEVVCAWRENHPEAMAVPLFTWATVGAAVTAERERCLRILRSVDNHSNPMTANDCADLVARGA
jgi:hypothetical protein